VADGATSKWFEVDVVTVSEQGLLGLAFHPKFAENGKFYLNYTPSGVRTEVTRIAEWVAPGGDLSATPVETRVILEQEQPYQNHNAGQIAFGPDGLLYIGFGDGGLRADPLSAGQDGNNWLGAMLRVDVDSPADGKEYGIPADNPGLSKPDWKPEVWAIGLRNPWRYSFAPDGRLVVADVGQNLYEEVTILPAGGNAGWSRREAGHCFPPSSSCDKGDLVDPIHEYPRGAGTSITGGYVSTGDAVPALKGKYVFADFTSGRVWALDLPATTEGSATVHALGKWPALISTFGRDGAGDLYMGDYGKGAVYKLKPGE